MSFTMLMVILPKYVVPFGSGAFNALILTQFQPEEKRDFEEGLLPGAYFKFVHTLAVDFSF